MTRSYPPLQPITSGWLGMRSAAARIGVSPGRLYELAHESAAAGVLTELSWLFAPAEVDAYVARRVAAPRRGRGYVVPTREQKE